MMGAARAAGMTMGLALRKTEPDETVSTEKLCPNQKIMAKQNNSAAKKKVFLING